jgi:hypothetical protein
MAKAKYKEEDPKRPTPVARDGAYVMMLFITLVAIVGGCVLMYLDTEEYSGKPIPKEPELKIKALGAQANLPDTAGAVPAPPAPAGPGPAGPGPAGPGPMGPMGGPAPMGPMGMPPAPGAP